MRVRLLGLWDALRTSYWFVPAGIVLLVLLLAPVTVAIDRTSSLEWLQRLPFVTFNQPQGARSLLSTVAGSTITVAGVTFSITMVVLSLAASQFGPRLLRNFMRDTVNQVVLGMFLATFLFCLLVLRTVQGANEGGSAFVPHLSITVATLLTLANLVLFIVFLHRTAESIQVGTVLGHIDATLSVKLGEQGRRSDEDGAEGVVATGLPADFGAAARPLIARRGGYLQTIDDENLLDLAGTHDLIVRALHEPGDFVAAGQPLALIYPGPAAQRLDERLRKHFSLGRHRTTTQDLGFLFDQLLEVALRALSPGVNDPITAMMCSDRIADNLLKLGRRPPPQSARFDPGGRLRLLLAPLDRGELARRLFAALRHHGGDDPMVLEHLLLHLERIGREGEDRDMRRALAGEVEALMVAARPRLEPADLVRIEQIQQRVRRAFAAETGDGWEKV